MYCLITMTIARGINSFHPGRIAPISIRRFSFLTVMIRFAYALSNTSFGKMQIQGKLRQNSGWSQVAP